MSSLAHKDDGDKTEADGIKEGSTLLKNRSEKKKTLRNIILYIAHFDNLSSSKRLMIKQQFPVSLMSGPTKQLKHF